ncbi:MAG: acyloxyacyl hydrolase [Candidatus Binatia bacterium]
MKNWRWWGVSCSVTLFLLCGGSVIHAEDVLPKAGTWEVGVRTGYIWGLRKHAEMIPVHLRIGYTAFQGKWWIIPEGALEISAEPFGSAIHSIRPGRSGSMELGLGLPVLTYYFDTGTRLTPYIEGGLGLLYTDLRGYSLGGHFSFMENIGVGANYFLSKNIAFNASWRYRHISNANLYDDNAGLDSGVFLAGFSYFLPQH